MPKSDIAQGEWNHRLNLLTGNAAYADIVELEMYNAALSGISLNGKRFFYSNKLNVGLKKRKGKFGGVRQTYFFCCPSKLPGFVSGISRWLYAKDSTGIYLNQYVGGDVQTSLHDKNLRLKVETKYPYYGKVKIEIENTLDKPYALNLRIPNWIRGKGVFKHGLYYFDDDKNPGYTISINGKTTESSTAEDGYVKLKRNWKKGDEVTLNMEMPVRRVYTKKEDKYNAGRVALMRGPLLYCLEGVDNDFDVSQFVLPRKTKITHAFDKNLLNGTMFLKGKGQVNGKNVNFKAIPYNLWQNRGISRMSVLLIEDPSKIYHEKRIFKAKHNTNG